MKILNTSFLLTIILLTFISCKKPEGKGGNSSIKGKVFVKKLNLNGTAVIGEYVGSYQNVYIIYGDNIVEGDRIQTNPDGIYEFKYLQPGNYRDLRVQPGFYIYFKFNFLTNTFPLIDELPPFPSGFLHEMKVNKIMVRRNEVFNIFIL